jgi:peptidoglycan/LPS O-acetylase OafA/YrhL
VDGYGGRASNLLFLSLLAAVPVALAGWVHARRRPPVNRVAASAGSLAMVALAIAALAQTLFTADGGTGVWPVWTGLGCFVALPFALLVCVSRIGRAEEQRRDMPDGSTKGRVS